VTTLLVNFLNKVKADLQAAFPAVRSIELHSGDVNAAEVQRLAPSSPTLLISIGSIGESESVGDGTELLPLTVVVYVMTKDQPRLSRFEAALNLVESLHERVNDNNFDFDGARTAKNIAAKNLFSGDIERQKVALWAVRWTQNVLVGESLFDDDGVVPTDLYVGITPDIGPGHEQDYVKVEVDNV
jgi:hypothetical protein